MSDTLFDLETTKNNADKKCKSCKNVLVVRYRSGKNFYYCSIVFDGRTDNKCKKIRLRDQACCKFEEKK